MVNVGKYTIVPWEMYGKWLGFGSFFGLSTEHGETQRCFVGSDAPAEAADQTLVHFIAMQMEKRPLCKTEKSSSFFQVTFWSPKWRSLNHLNPWKGHLKHPKGHWEESGSHFFLKGHNDKLRFGEKTKKQKSFRIGVGCKGMHREFLRPHMLIDLIVATSRTQKKDDQNR